MPRYSYVAKTLKGQPHKGVLEAENTHVLARILRKEGYILISAEEQKKKKKRKFNISFGRVSVGEKMMFTRNLKVMISAGISIPRSLKILSEQVKTEKFRKILVGIANEITKGSSFSEGIAKHPGVFSELFINMIKVGEESGQLEEVLANLTNQMEREYDLKSKIKGAVIYPAVIVGAMVLIGILMLILVIPKLAQTFEELNVELPATTRLVIGVGEFTANYWYTLPLILAAIFFLLRFASKTETGKKVIDTAVLKIPIVSGIVKKVNSARTARTLSSLIDSGVPIVRSLEILSGALGNIYYKRAMVDAASKIKKGIKLGEVLEEYQDIYPHVVVQMVKIGEETGQTSEILSKLADFYEEQVTAATKNLSAVIEPVLMIIIGAAVGFFAISMVQPMYSMLQAF